MFIRTHHAAPSLAFYGHFSPRLMPTSHPAASGRKGRGIAFSQVNLVVRSTDRRRWASPWSSGSKNLPHRRVARSVLRSAQSVEAVQVWLGGVSLALGSRPTSARRGTSAKSILPTIPQAAARRCPFAGCCVRSGRRDSPVAAPGTRGGTIRQDTRRASPPAP